MNNGPKTERPVGEIEEAMNFLEKSITHLETGITDLENELNQILAIPCPVEAAKGKEPRQEGQSSPLGQKLYCYNDRIYCLLDQVRQIIDRSKL